MEQWAKRLFHYSTTPALLPLASHHARLQRDRLKTRNTNWDCFVRANWRHFLFVLRIAAMTWWHQILVIEIITHLIRIEHLCGNELPTGMANPIAEREFITG